MILCVWNPQLNSSYLGSLEQLQSNAGVAGDIWSLLYSSVWCLVSKITGMAEMVGCWASISISKQLLCKTSLSPLSMVGPWWSDHPMWLLPPVWAFQRIQVEAVGFLLRTYSFLQVPERCFLHILLVKKIARSSQDPREWELDSTSQCKEHHKYTQKALKIVINVCMS